jgi:two-component system copper resistance phosphate regulon response regulator CusR
VRLLFLEDDSETARSVSRALTERGFEVRHAGDVETALAALEETSPEAAVLDVRVPGGSGYQVLKAIRARDRHVPVLILTALDAVDQRVQGLERGADDYLVKPFAFSELVARLRALLRRPGRRLDLLQAGRVEIDPLRGRASCEGIRLELTRTEFALLQALSERRGEVLNRQLLLELVWGYRFDPGTNIVDVHVNRLRRKLADVGEAERIRTVRGVGYVVD